VERSIEEKERIADDCLFIMLFIVFSFVSRMVHEGMVV